MRNRYRLSPSPFRQFADLVEITAAEPQQRQPGTDLRRTGPPKKSWEITEGPRADDVERGYLFT
jgi:hypothetical protein